MGQPLFVSGVASPNLARCSRYPNASGHLLFELPAVLWRFQPTKLPEQLDRGCKLAICL